MNNIATRNCLKIIMYGLLLFTALSSSVNAAEDCTENHCCYCLHGSSSRSCIQVDSASVAGANCMQDEGKKRHSVSCDSLFKRKACNDYCNNKGKHCIN